MTRIQQDSKREHYMVLPFCRDLSCFKVLPVVLYFCFWFPDCSSGLTYNFSMTLDSHEIFPTGDFTKLYFTGLFTGFLEPGGSDGKEFACHAGNAGLIPGSGRSPGEGMGTHPSILAWRIPWTEKRGGLQTVGSQRVGMIERLTLAFWPFHRLS